RRQARLRAPHHRPQPSGDPQPLGPRDFAMTPSFSAGQGCWPPHLARLVDQVCDRFEAAWKAGGPGPPIADYLGEVPEPDRSVLAAGLIAPEVPYRRLRDEPPQHAEYCQRFPALDPETLTAAVGSQTGAVPERRPRGTGEPGRFQLLEQVGLGTFGAVWRARDTRLDRTVALKVPHP